MENKENKDKKVNKHLGKISAIIFIIIILLLVKFCERKEDKVPKNVSRDSSIKEVVIEKQETTSRAAVTCLDRVNTGVKDKLVDIDISSEVIIHFGFDSAEIMNNELIKIASIAKKLENAKEIHITGYADARGDKEYNQGLSTRRVKSVRSCFESLGSKVKFVEKHWGEGHPAAFGTNKKAFAKNRRVEIEIK